MRGQPSSYLEEKIPERDVIAGLDLFGFFLFVFALFLFLVISVFFPLLLCLPQMCTDRDEEESQWESVPGTGAYLLQGTPVSNAFYRGSHKAPVSFVHSPAFLRQ